MSVVLSFISVLRFLEKGGEILTIKISSSRTYKLHRTPDLDGRKFVNEGKRVIFIMDNPQSASLTDWDILWVGCQGKVPAWLVDGKSLPD